MKKKIRRDLEAWAKRRLEADEAARRRGAEPPPGVRREPSDEPPASLMPPSRADFSLDLAGPLLPKVWRRATAKTGPLHTTPIPPRPGAPTAPEAAEQPQAPDEPKPISAAQTIAELQALVDQHSSQPPPPPPPGAAPATAPTQALTPPRRPRPSPRGAAGAPPPAGGRAKRPPPDGEERAARRQERALRGLPAETAAILTRIAGRPTRKASTAAHIEPPRMKLLVFKATLLQVLTRLVAWTVAWLMFIVGNAKDVALRKDSVERRARRLRKTFEVMGGTFIKVGQQMSARVDLLPIVYCDELAKMLDKVKPFPTAQAIAAIEQATGKPLHETFAAFDPTPIGSASIACVYLAQLASGERVAVKVRRPEIGRLFAADLEAFERFTKLLESLTIMRPGFFKNFHFDLRLMLLEELDFRREARFGELFRRAAKKHGHKAISAPKVYHQLSGEDVLVTEFVTGVWLSELIEANESADTRQLERLRAMDIDPETICYRLMDASVFGQLESPVFHADPHPANICIQPGNKLIFVDFGACGSMTERDRRIIRYIFHNVVRRDAVGVVDGALAQMEPMPPIDVGEVARKLEMSEMQFLQAIDSKHSAWWERTTASLWLRAVELTREYEIPLNINMLRSLRCSLLYDTLAGRLNHKPDFNWWIKRFFAHEKKERRKKARKKLRKRLRNFDLGRALLDLTVASDELQEMGNKAVYRLQRSLEATPHRYIDQIRKASYAALHAIRLVATTSFLTGAVTLFVASRTYSATGLVALQASFFQVITSGWYGALMGLLVARELRRVAFRFSEKDVDRR